MSVFDQKPLFASRPLEWLTSGGRANYARTSRLFRLVREEFSGPNRRNLSEGNVAVRLLPLRGDFRQVMRQQHSIGLLQTFARDINPLIRAISVWLLSKHANRFLLLGIENLRHDHSPLVRRRVARALRKLEARELLAEMAEAYPHDERIQWYAKFEANQKSYRERLENFVGSVESPVAAQHTYQSRMPLWFRDEYWSGSPPKSVEFMREILWRIRSLVRG